jgi:hypothetical protein
VRLAYDKYRNGNIDLQSLIQLKDRRLATRPEGCCKILILWCSKLLMESDKATEARRAFNRLARAKEIGRSAIEITAEEAMTWDVFRWMVIVLLVLNLILTLFLYSGASEQLAEAKAELTADIVAAQFGLRQAPSQMQSEPTTDSIDMPSTPMPAKSPRRR